MGETFLIQIPSSQASEPAARPVSPLAMNPVPEPPDGEDPIECEPVKLPGCAFWRGEWHPCCAGQEARVTARELGYGGPGYCLFEMRCATTCVRVARQGWYLNWRRFTPTQGMRLIADYRSDTDSKPKVVAGHGLCT